MAGAMKGLSLILRPAINRSKPGRTILMLELRPNCEHCDKALPPSSSDAMICSYECTYCKLCAIELLKNTCPNCGGGFSQRPIRPSRNWKNDNCLSTHPASKKRIHHPVNLAVHDIFSNKLKDIPANER